MQRISLECLQKLIAKDTFIPPVSEGPPKLSGTTTILLVFQTDGQHERITDVYVGLMVHRVDSHLYTLDQILDFVKNIEGNLKMVHYCLIYPMSYMRDVEPDHLNTHNNLAGTHLHHCMCCATLQYMNDEPKQHRKYSESHLILPCGARYKE